MKTTATTITIWLFLLFVAGSSINLFIKEKANSRRISRNLEAVTQEAEYFKTRDGKQAARINTLEVTNRELRRVFPVLASNLKNLHIPPQRAISYTQTSQAMNASITAPVKDTVLQPVEIPNSEIQIPKLEPIPVRTLDYQDEWIKINASFAADSGTVSVAATDTIFTAIHRGQRVRPWAWIFSRRKLQTSASNRNPYISIHVVSSGIIKK